MKVSLSSFSVPYLKEIPILGPIIFTEQNVLVYIGIGLAFVLWFVLFRTSWGITIRSVGENPATADALGIDVSLVRYLCVVLGGLLAGAGGAYLSIIYRPSWNQGYSLDNFQRVAPPGRSWRVIYIRFSFLSFLQAAAVGGSRATDDDAVPFYDFSAASA